MNQGLGMTSVVMTLVALALLTSSASAQIYKIVDENGNVTFTDQAPADGSAPMVLPELSVIKSDSPAEEAGAEAAGAEVAEETTAPAEPTLRDLKRMYRDFRIIAPANEETFWGTANSVVISWGSDTPLQPGMKVRVFINGVQQAETQSSTMALTLDRGAHTVSAQLLDARGRRLVTTSTVTFFIQQRAVGFNLPVRPPVSGH